LGVVNIYVAKNFDESTWVTFKLIGMTLLNLTFFLGQFFYLSRFMKEEEEAEAETDSTNSASNKQD